MVDSTGFSSSHQWTQTKDGFVCDLCKLDIPEGFVLSPRIEICPESEYGKEKRAQRVEALLLHGHPWMYK